MPTFLISALLAMQPSSPVGQRRPTGVGGRAAVSATVSFSKYHGLGNDFVLIDCRETGTPALSPDQAAQMCDRNFGVGADGVIFVLPSDVPEAKSRMRIYNSD